MIHILKGFFLKQNRIFMIAPNVNALVPELNAQSYLQKTA
jgi:hypothetical protein